MTGASFRGVCPTCNGNYAVTKKGLIGKHLAAKPENDRGDGKCKGSEQPFKITGRK